MVKTIFKALIGTVVIIGTISMLTEYINVTTTSTFMKGIITRSVTKSCDYFVQETYKEEGAGASVAPNGDAVDLLSSEGQTAVSGNFFSGNSPEEVYKAIYSTDKFKSFINSLQVDVYTGSGNSKSRRSIKGLWKNLDILNYGLFGIANNLTDGEKRLGENYSDTMTSASNLGIVYLDNDVINKIARWNLVANLSEGKTSNIHSGTNTKDNYISYKGFRIYYNTFRVTDIQYTVYDRSTDSGRKNLEKVTNITSNYLTGIDDERKYICVADIKYNIDIGYVGITPMRKILQYTISHQVDGLDANAVPSAANLSLGEDAISTFDSSNNADIPFAGEITYYIIR